MMQIESMEIVWTSEHARDYYKMVQREIERAFTLPGWALGRQEVTIDFQRRAYAATEQLRNMACQLYSDHTRIVCKVRP